MPLPNPVIVVPGITASYLRDEYALPPEIVWSVLTTAYERASLHPDNLRYEAIEPARVMPDQLFEVAYKELIEELRYNLRKSENQPVPVYPFAYDWRQSLEQTEAQLADFMDEVIERTRLMRHYNDDGYANRAKVDLVGHSMGGLLIAGVLYRRGREARVGKVATLATPFRGSFEAVIKVITGTANLGTSPPSSREREAARMTPALYQLFPSLAGGLQEVPTGTEPSFFNPSVWQQSIVQTIRDYVIKYGLNPAGAEAQASQLFTALLQNARDHRTRIENLDLEQAGLSKADWLCVVGVNSETRVRMRVTPQNGGLAFDLTSQDRDNGWAQEPDRQTLTGDGTVPFDGARPGFLELENLVCVTPEDFGYWEVADRTLLKVAGFHGIMPNMNMLHRLIVTHFAGRPASYGNVWGRPAPGVANWAPPIAGLPAKADHTS